MERGGGLVMYTEEEASRDDGQSGRDTITRGTEPTIPPRENTLSLAQKIPKTTENPKYEMQPR